MMSFFDSFQKGLEEQSTKYGEMQRKSRELEQEKYEHLRNLRNLSDSALLSKLNGIFASDQDKKIIEEILISRGYKKATNGTFHRI